MAREGAPKGAAMEALTSDTAVQVAVAVVVIAGCTFIASKLAKPAQPASACGSGCAPSTATAGGGGGGPSLQVLAEGLPVRGRPPPGAHPRLLFSPWRGRWCAQENPPRALAAALKSALGLDATPVLLALGEGKTVVRLGSAADATKLAALTTARVLGVEVGLTPYGGAAPAPAAAAACKPKPKPAPAAAAAAGG